MSLNHVAYTRHFSELAECLEVDLSTAWCVPGFEWRCRLEYKEIVVMEYIVNEKM